MTMIKIHSQVLGIAILAMSVGMLHADGVTDVRINPATGLTISVPGNYRLASSVTMTSDVEAVNIASGNVTFDLNGHTITGPAVSTEHCIEATSTGTTVLGGNIVGFGQTGVLIQGAGGVVRDMKVSNCNKVGGFAGIRVGVNSIVERCIVLGCTPTSTGSTVGIQSSNNCQVIGNIVEANDSPNSTVTGISANGNNLVLENVVKNNRITGGSSLVVGISIGAASLARENTVSDNDNLGTGEVRGINASATCTVLSNTVTNHTTGTTGSGACSGIFALTDCKVTGNSCMNNDAGVGSNGNAIGIVVGNQSEVRENVSNNHNAQGTGIAAGIQGAANCVIVENQCRANSGGASSSGIRVTSAGNIVAHNVVGGSAMAGLCFVIETNNRAHSNQVRQINVFDTNNGETPSSVGTGDLVNVTY